MKKTNLLVKLAIGGVLIAGAAYLYHSYYPYSWNGYGGYHMGWGMGGHWGMGVLMPLFWLLLFVAGIFFLGSICSKDHVQDGSPAGGPDAAEILKRRYARGEIDITEFRTKMDEIHKP